MTRTLHVELADRRYPIHIGAGLLTHTDFRPFLSQPKAIIVTNETVAPHYLATLLNTLHQQDIHTESIILPDGEVHKSLHTLEHVLTRLLELRAERKTTLIALGGGVIGDLAGFAAAIYQRGMPFIQVPTTLLAQVDSSVGGKTAVNHPLGKNMIGAFYQPKAVIIDTDTLHTLPNREYHAGWAEIIKYGLIRESAFLDWIETHAAQLAQRQPDLIAEAIYRSCQHKALIVAEDESEQGVRALLNLGHTFGHAIETGLGYGVWLHGEAVAAGTVMAAALSHQAGWISSADVQRVEQLMQRFSLPIRGPQLGGERYWELMQHDKKVEHGQLRLIALKKLGQADIIQWDNLSALIRVINAYCTPST
jgi:3-dehydroquinate synthase